MFMETGCSAAFTDCSNSGALMTLRESSHCGATGRLRRELAGLGFLASFARGVGASLNSREVVIAAARHLYDYFHYDLAVFSLPVDSGGLTAFSPQGGADIMNDCFMNGESYPALKSWQMNDHGPFEPEESAKGGFSNGCGAIVEIAGEGTKVTLYCGQDGAEKATPELLTGIAGSLTAALGNAREHARVKELSVRDSLTGLYNRRVLEEFLALEESRREPTPLAILIIDVDDFKAINDNFGHPAGDRVLSVLGKLLQENCRKENIVARYGGEEFAVLMTNSGLSAAVATQTAERLRKVMGAQDFAFSGRKVKLTVSIGVAFSSVGSAMENMLARADQALYRAKRSGKNRVCFHDPDCHDGMPKNKGTKGNVAALR